MLRCRDWRGVRVLLLQGPVGPYFARLARQLRAAGADVTKVNFNGGDVAFFPGGLACTRHPGERLCWLRRLIEDRDIGVVALFGDCRPVHAGVDLLCAELGRELFVFEEGYFRPAYITCEPWGVNARSRMPRDPHFYRASRAAVRREPAREIPPHRWSYGAMATWALLYYAMAGAMAWRFRHYRHHRPLTVLEGLPWLRGIARKAWYRLKEQGLQQRLAGGLSRRYFLVPLQVHNDAQVTHHSAFDGVAAFIDRVARSFAAHAGAQAWLVFKHHPMDRAYTHHGPLIRRLARELGIADRVIYLHDQHLPTLIEHAAGVVVINSTAGLSALNQGVATVTLGQAFYDMAGLTFQGPLDQFWAQAATAAPDRDLYLAFRNWVIEHAQCNDNFYAGLARQPGRHDIGATGAAHRA